MESQPQNPEFRINSVNFHQWFNTKLINWPIPSLLFQTRGNSPLVHKGLISN